MRRLSALALAVLAACGTSPRDPDEEADAGTTPDAGAKVDAGQPPAPDAMPAIPSTVSRADATCSNGRKVFVRRAVDGDTLELSDNLPDHEHVRLVGVNTPETHPENNIQCYGPEAAAWTESVIVNRLGCLTYDPAVTRQSNNKDMYGRTLGYLFFGTDNARFLNAELVYNGYARDFPFTNGAVYATYLRNLKNNADGANRGLWGVCE